MTYLGQNIRYLRKQKGLSQTDFAKSIGLNRSNIASYEKGIAEPKAKTLVKMLSFFNLELSHLLDRDLEAMGYRIDRDDSGGISKGSIISQPFIQEFKDQTKNLHTILEGFKEYHLFKMSGREFLSRDLQMMAHDYEKIIDLLENYIKINHELISKIENHSKLLQHGEEY